MKNRETWILFVSIVVVSSFSVFFCFLCGFFFWEPNPPPAPTQVPLWTGYNESNVNKFFSAQPTATDRQINT
jgi:hypothetical protein